MKRALVTRFHEVVLQDVPAPQPGAGEALIKVEVCGICGSDIHAFLGQHPFINPPVVPGHELSGVIAALGPGVSGLQIGARVTAEPSLVCGVCRHCRSGRYNICDNLRVIGCQADGALAEYLLVPAAKVIPLPDDLTFEQGAMIEPVAVAVHAVARAEPGKAGVTAIIGAGTIGLLTLQAAVAAGAGTTIVTDTLDERLALAKQLGATHTVNVKKTDLEGWMQEHFGVPNPVDLSFDCVGLGPSIDSAIRMAQKGSRIIAVGVYPGKVPVEMDWVQDRELEIVGTLMYTHADWLAAIELVRSGKVQVMPLVSRQEPLERVPEVFATFEHGPGADIKLLIGVSAARRQH